MRRQAIEMIRTMHQEDDEQMRQYIVRQETQEIQETKGSKTNRGSCKGSQAITRQSTWLQQNNRIRHDIATDYSRQIVEED